LESLPRFSDEWKKIPPLTQPVARVVGCLSRSSRRIAHRIGCGADDDTSEHALISQPKRKEKTCLRLR
jgi:hypothetical protein